MDVSYWYFTGSYRELWLFIQDPKRDWEKTVAYVKTNIAESI